MSDDDDRNEEGIYRADTVPPPDGGEDAYSAPTRVGPMAATVVNEILMAAQAAQAEQSAARAQAVTAKPKGGDGGELDERDIAAELDPVAFPPPPRLPGLRSPPVPSVASPPAPTPSLSPSAAPPPASPIELAGAQELERPAKSRLPIIVLVCAGLAVLLTAAVYVIMAVLRGT
jgi:hypothetical protein